MVVGAFPLAKLGTLLLRQISKPIANVVKERAKKSPFFRTYICMPPAQFYNWCEVKAKMWVMNLGKPVTVPSLNDAMAIELGANLLGEGIIFAIATIVLYMEYMRSIRKEAAKEEALKSELSVLHYTIQELYFTTEKQDAQIREMTRVIADLENRVVRKPWVRPGSKPPSDSSSDPSESPSSVGNMVIRHGDLELISQSRNMGLFLEAVNYVQNDVIHRR